MSPRCLLMLSLLQLLGCTGYGGPSRWNQFHGDIGNSGQKFVATIPPATTRNFQLALSGREIVSSSVVAPSGDVVISTFEPPMQPGGRRSALHILTPGNTPSVKLSYQGDGQFSTAAIDDAGNIYVVLDPPGEGDWVLLSLNPAGQLQWQRNFRSNGRAFGPPKLLPYPGGSILVVPSAGNKISIFNDRGDLLRSDFVCVVVEGGLRNPFEFKVRPLEFPPPYFEGPVPGLAVFEDSGPRNVYMAIPINRCGIAFYQLQLGATVKDMPRLIPAPNQHIEDVYYRSAAISADGVAIVSASDGEVTGFNIRTGKQIFNRALIRPEYGAEIAFLPLAINFAYLLTDEKLHKVDITTGIDVIPAIPVLHGYGLVSSASYLHVVSEGRSEPSISTCNLSTSWTIRCKIARRRSVR
ncbi:hypothetical protein H9L13_05700 [Sphingomonas lutea]|uniref:6-bladed beta-propeller n=1 Tax=Sphingomonas lutea TaxID=1045317 RepID=A0A7G9SKI2_9SPHN|nr:hypothetical protein [Sphingomonas lutea]QNN68357.1 hypothetical protein H9L13_05700 [Sphingomonas lutea]